MNIPSLIFYHLIDNVRQTRDGSDRTKNYIPFGRLISCIIAESVELKDRDEKDLEMACGEPFNVENWVEMGILEKVSKPVIRWENLLGCFAFDRNCCG